LLRRQRDLLSLLLNAEGVMTGAELSLSMEVSLRTIQIDIKSINHYLLQYQIGVTSLRKQGYLLTDSAKQVMKSHDIIRSVVDVAYLIQPPVTPDERVMFILLRLIRRPHYLIEELEHDLSISNSTLNGDILLAKRWLKKHVGSDAKLTVSLKLGVSLKADEKARVKIISRYLCLHTNMSFTNKCYHYLFGQIDAKQAEYREYVFTLLHEVSRQHGYSLTGHSTHFLCHLITILLVSTELTPGEYIKRDDIELITIIEALKWQLARQVPVSISDSVWILIQGYFQSCQFLPATDLAKISRPESERVTEAYYQQILQIFGVDLSVSASLRMALLRYVGPLFYRLEQHHSVPDAISANLLREHRAEAEMVKVFSDIVVQMSGLVMPHTELAYICLYLVNSRSEWRPTTRLYIVSDLDQSVIDYMIQMVITPLADKVQLIGMCTYQQFLHYPPANVDDIDFILTTSTMADKTEVPSLHFNLSMNSQKILEIQQRILRCNQRCFSLKS
jgi:lichenan operon transcriptional antiterminator